MTNYKRRNCDGSCEEQLDNQQRIITELRAENERLKIQKADVERESADWKARFETAQSELAGTRAKMRLIHSNPHYTHYDANWDGGRREGIGY